MPDCFWPSFRALRQGSTEPNDAGQRCFSTAANSFPRRPAGPDALREDPRGHRAGDRLLHGRRGAGLYHLRGREGAQQPLHGARGRESRHGEGRGCCLEPGHRCKEGRLKKVERPESLVSVRPIPQM